MRGVRVAVVMPVLMIMVMVVIVMGMAVSMGTTVLLVIACHGRRPPPPKIRRAPRFVSAVYWEDAALPAVAYFSTSGISVGKNRSAAMAYPLRVKWMWSGVISGGFAVTQ